MDTPSCRALQDASDAIASGDVGIGTEVLLERCIAFIVLQQIDGGEVRQRQPFVKNESGFDTTISEEKTTRKLGQMMSVACHVFSPLSGFGAAACRSQHRPWRNAVPQCGVDHLHQMDDIEYR